jgi:hypothetical protein
MEEIFYDSNEVIDDLYDNLVNYSEFWSVRDLLYASDYIIDFLGLKNREFEKFCKNRIRVWF